VLLALARRAARARISVELARLGRQPGAVDYARTQASVRGVKRGTVRARRHARAISFLAAWTWWSCTLFLHHLGDGDAVALLRRMKEAGAGRAVVGLRLRRTAWGPRSRGWAAASFRGPMCFARTACAPWPRRSPPTRLESWPIGPG